MSSVKGQELKKVLWFSVVPSFGFNFPRDFSPSRWKNTGARQPPLTLEMATEDNATKTKQLRASAGGCAEINGEFKHLGGAVALQDVRGRWVRRGFKLGH